MKTKLVITMLLTLMIAGCGKEFKGEKGDPGQTGSRGAQGEAGEDVVQPYAVQLCPSQPAPEYPSHFPEIALCLQGKLYGVYNQSNHVDYLTELPPGDYASIAPEGCNLVVKPNCEVEQQ